ncbi:MAG: Rieske (2Fe-2S) protein [bacterium]
MKKANEKPGVNPTEHANPADPGESRANPAGTGGLNRRGFLSMISVAVGAVAAALVAAPITGFLLGPVFRKRTAQWRAVGAVDGFTRGDTVKVDFKDAEAKPWAGETGRTAAWLQRRADGDIVAFSLDCTHLGCPVRWEPGTQLFMCPCHGGVYYADGSVAGGPPPRPLTRYPVRVRNGQVEIRTEPLPIT